MQARFYSRSLQLLPKATIQAMDPTNLQGHAQGKMRQQGPAAPRRYDGQDGAPLYDPSQGGHYGKAPFRRFAWKLL